MKASYSPTMDQIAKELGVSISTVSRVINCREARISTATKARVIEAAARLGYSPNFLASSLSKGSGTRTIGICVGLDEFYTRVVDGIIEYLGHMGYAAIVMPARTGGPGEQDVFRAFVERRVEGVILRPSSYNVKSEYFKELEERGLPIVLIDVELHELKMPFCGTDDYMGGRLAAEHLLSLGHRKLGHVAGDQNVRTGSLRKKGFLDGVASVPGASAVVCRHEGYITDVAAIREMLSAKDRPTAVFCANDSIAAGVYHAAFSLGLEIPGDLSVLGFANQIFSESMSPSLSSFDQHPGLIGRNAIELLFAFVEGKSVSKEEARLVRPEIVLRASTAAPKASGNTGR